MRAGMTSDLKMWRDSRRPVSLPWWLWPVSLLWRREPEAQDTVPVPQYVDTVPTDQAPL